jgi:gas vesicle protein
VNSIEDERAREVVLDLFFAPVYSTSTTSEVKDGEPPEPEDQYEDANRNEELKEEIKKLSKLTGDALDEEVKKLVKEVLDENKNKKDLKWNQEFVDKYVKEYCPEYLPVIEENTDGENSTDDPLYYKRDDV